MDCILITIINNEKLIFEEVMKIVGSIRLLEDNVNMIFTLVFLIFSVQYFPAVIFKLS